MALETFHARAEEASPQEQPVTYYLPHFSETVSYISKLAAALGEFQDLRQENPSVTVSKAKAPLFNLFRGKFQLLKNADIATITTLFKNFDRGPEKTPIEQERDDGELEKAWDEFWAKNEATFIKNRPSETPSSKNQDTAP